jgi:hypothetical protein
MNPRVFLSHASEDKDRFVLKFAEKLIAKGVDIWLDKWEMSPGDSTIDKIFEEGLKNSQAIIIVLSKISVKKPWVKEELNVSMAKRINEGIKLIPVIIDDCEVPECLKATVWEKIDNIDNYENELERIVMSLFGHIKKPSLGLTPVYTHTIVDDLPGLNEIDSIIINIACKKAIEIGNLEVAVKDIYANLKELEIPDRKIAESLEILDNYNYIKASRNAQNYIRYFSVTDYGFENYWRRSLVGYDNIVESVVYSIINNNMNNNIQLSKILKQPIMLINHILRKLISRNLLKTSARLDGNIYIEYISPELKRKLS